MASKQQDLSKSKTAHFSMEGEMVRQFDTGANRDVDTGKYDYEGFLSPLVLQEFAKYMHQNRTLKDGSVRDSDNWQKGIPKDAYMKSAWRHFMDLWMLHRGYPVIRPEDGKEVDLNDALMGLLFNVQGYAHEVMKNQPLEAPISCRDQLCYFNNKGDHKHV